MSFSTKAFQVSEIAADQRYAVVGGPFGSKLGRKDYTTEGIPVLRGSNLPLEKRIDLTKLVFVTAEKVRKDLFGNLAHPGDIVVTQRGTLGQVGLIPTDSAFERFVVSQSQMKLTVDPAKADGRFVYYYLKSPATTKRLIDRASSSGVPHINLEVFRNFDVELPDLNIQQSVADILTLFDDLIENNRRRMEVLEGMARLLFREWFVYFRYPGHEGVELVDSDLGPIPEGWEVLSASVALEINPRLKVEKEREDPFITMNDLGIWSMVCQPSKRKSGSSGAKFQNGDTLFARITPCLENGKTGFVQCLSNGEVGRGSTEFIVLRGRYLGPEYTYLLAREDAFRQHAIKSMSGSSGRQRVRTECFDSYLLAVSPFTVMERFSEVTAPMFQLVATLADQNVVLREVRDLLLPRLVSGELDVSELDLDLAVGL